jgi:hypothetical protein
MAAARRLLFLTLCAGCAAPPMKAPQPDDPLPAPLLGVERPLQVQRLPGEPPSAWPVAITVANGRVLLPWRDSAGLHVRIDGVDTDLGAGEWLGAAPMGDRFAALVVAPGGRPVLHVLDGMTDQSADLGLAGKPVPAVASDGERVLLVTTDYETAAASGPPLARALVAGGAQVTRFDLGYLQGTPSLFGDRDGFIVDSRLTVAADGALDRAPAEQVPGARLFRRADPIGDTLTVDGGGWLPLTVRVLSATRDTAGIELVVPDDADGQRIMHVGEDLTSVSAPLDVPRAASVPGFVRAIAGTSVLWEAPIGSDRVFAGLDRATLAPRGWFVRVSDPASRTVSIAYDGRSAHLAWTTRDGGWAYAKIEAP